MLATSLALTLALSGVSSITSIINPTQVEAAGFDYSQVQQEMLQEINAIRAKVGSPALQLNPFLNKAAENHASYLNSNGYGYHYSEELASKKGFTGKSLHNRLDSVGYSYTNKDLFMDVAVEADTAKEAVSLLLKDADTRSRLLYTSSSNAGIAKVGNDFVVIAEDRNVKADLTVYPYDGQTGVDTEYSYIHEPYAEHAHGKKWGDDNYGFAISIQGYDDGLSSSNANYTLKDSKGNVVPVNKNRMTFTTITPEEPLKGNEKYTVTMQSTTSSKTKTWSFTTKASSVVAPTPEPSKPTPTPEPTKPTPKPEPVKPTTPSVVYTDFQKDAYWADNMLWAIDKGIISGYVPVKNPKTGKMESQLRPKDSLTEAQFLSVLFRYTHPTELENTKPKDANYWASTAYQLAEKYNLPTNAKLNSRGAATKPITRGKMAHILASLHYGKPVSTTTAVSFMYKAELSEGYLDKSGKAPKTYASYGVNEVLQRAHIVTFMKNYDTYLSK